MADDQHSAKPGGPEDSTSVRHADWWLRSGENVVYAGAGALLLAGAIAVVVVVAYRSVTDLDHGAQKAVADALDGLLLVFILLELLAGVRATMTERKLVAEPFLIVGIIASIKEIVVVALQSKQARGSGGDAFEDAMVEIGVLAGVILFLSLATYLVRLKEREPSEN